jgi:hypothetical protein
MKLSSVFFHFTHVRFVFIIKPEIKYMFCAGRMLNCDKTYQFLDLLPYQISGS